MSLVFAPDLADVVVRALDTPAAAGQTVNVASDQVVTAGELAGAIAATLRRRTIPLRLPATLLNLVCWSAARWATLTGRPTILAHGKHRELTAPGWVGDTNRLQATLGPVCLTRLADGLEASRSWYREHGWI